MAVEVQRFSTRFADRRYGRHSRQGRTGLRGLTGQLAAIGCEASPWIITAVVAACPFVTYSVGQARLTSALNTRNRLLRQIQNDRIEITGLRDEIREVLSPAQLAAWAKKHGMQPTSDIVPLEIDTPRPLVVASPGTSTETGKPTP